MEARRPLIEGLAQAIWRFWYRAWCWLLLMLLAPFWAYTRAQMIRAQQDRFAAQEALQEAAYRHLDTTFLRLEAALADRRVLELDSWEARVAADEALRAFLRRLVAIEAVPLPVDAEPTIGNETDEARAAD